MFPGKGGSSISLEAEAILAFEEVKKGSDGIMVVVNLKFKKLMGAEKKVKKGVIALSVLVAKA